MQNENEFKIQLHKCKGGYVGELNIPKKIQKTKEVSLVETIIILDRSGSMGQEVNKIVTQIIPKVLQGLNYDDSKPVHLITFDSEIEYKYMTKKEFEVCKMSARGCTYMAKVFEQIQRIIMTKKASYRILTISDGDVHDQLETVEKACLLAKEIKGKITINSQAIRFFTSSSQPDTRALSSVLQFSSIGEPSLIDIDAHTNIDEISGLICSLFSDDGMDITISLKAKSKVIKNDPWSAPSQEIKVFQGKNVFWISEPDNLQILIGKSQLYPVEIENVNEIDEDNYKVILGNKINWYLQKLKVLKIVGTEAAMKELNEIVQYFQQFEESLTKIEDDEEMKKYTTTPKIATRINLMKKMIKKRTGTIASKMKEIQNDEKISQLNSQQKADYLRNINTNDKTGKGLAKRAFLEGIDFDDTARKEVIEMSKHIKELSDINESSHSISFYSTTSTLEGIRLLCQLVNDSCFNELEANDIIKLLNIVGIACEGKINNYPDPALYHLTNIYPGCYVSFSDILEVATINKDEELKVPGGTGFINNAIPIFDDERIHQFLLKYAPHLLEYTASIGMRRILAEVPNTYENMIVAGLWKMMSVLNTSKSEINIKTFLALLNSCQLAAGKKYLGVIKEINNQKEEKSLALYINNYTLNNMITPLLTMIREKKHSTQEIQKVIRAIYQFEVYQVIRSWIRQQDDQNKFVTDTLRELLGIDFEKHGTKLPAMFEKNLSPKYYEQYELNETKLNEIYNQKMKWTELISMLPEYFDAASQDKSEELIKQIPTLDDELFQKNMGIEYDLKLFKLFNIVQSFVNKEKSDRVDDDKKVMKIIDLVNFGAATKKTKTYVLRQYQFQYQAENQKQIKLQIDIISKELVDKLLASTTKEDYIKLMREGITKGYLNYKLEDTSTKGVIELRDGLKNTSITVPLRLDKIKLLLLAVDEQEQPIWNKGNCMREKIGDFKEIVDELDKTAWETILNSMKGRKSHIYRALANRQGHSNDKPSYWAIGFDTLDSMWEVYSDQQKADYQKIHYNCCGVPGNTAETYKSQQRKIRKEKRKQFRLNKK